MRVGFDAKRVFCNFTGLGNYGRTLLENLYQFHPEVHQTLFTPNKKLDFFSPLIESNKVELVMPKSMYALKGVNSLWRSFALPHLFKNFKIDLYHGLSHELPFNPNPQIKTVVTMHDLIYLRYPHFFPFIDRQTYNLKFRYACKVADKIIAICQQTADDLINFFSVPAHKIEVVYQAINPIFYQRLTDGDKQSLKKKYGLPEQYLFFVGRLEERKNVKNIVRAFGQLRKKIDHKLVIVGDGGTYKNELLKLIEELQIKDRVVMLGRVPHEDLPGLYQLASLLVFPSIFEGFGIPLVEALASSIPVVTTKGGCFPEAIGEGGVFVDPLNVMELSEAISSVLLDSNCRKNLIELGQKHILKFNPQVLSDQLVDIYKKVIA